MNEDVDSSYESGRLLWCIALNETCQPAESVSSCKLMRDRQGNTILVPIGILAVFVVLVLLMLLRMDSTAPMPPPPPGTTQTK